MDLGLRGRVAIGGGGSKGIGRATALLIATEGANVVVAARGREALDRTADEVRACGVDVVAQECDMAVEADINRLIAAAVARFGRIDVLVNNAGGPPLGRFEQHDDASWRRAIELNLMSVVRCVRGALPHLKQSDQARVVNITSTAVKEPIDGLILSNAVRLGTTGLAKTLSKELGAHGITVNNVAPGMTLTDRMRPLIEAQAQAQSRPFVDVAEERARSIPTGRMGAAEDVAAAIVFLASAQARQITGQTIVVDGGAGSFVL